MSEHLVIVFRGNNPLTVGCALLAAIFTSFQKQLGSPN